MEFELKNVVSVGDVKSKNEEESSQYLNVTVGVVDCPYNMTETTTVEYVFSNKLSVQEVKDGVVKFAKQWVEENYPKI